MLLKTIVFFDEQTYGNRELVISYPETDLETRKVVSYFLENTAVNIIRIEHRDGESVGTSRNNAVKKCNGKYVCIWDDDDLHDPVRLAFQYDYLARNEEYSACILTQILLYHAYRSTAYLSFPAYWTCTLLCVKEEFLVYPFLDKNEFEYTPVLTYLRSANMLLGIGSNPTIYAAVYHGENVMKYTVFLYLINQSSPIQQELSNGVKAYVNLKLGYSVKDN